MFPAPSPNSQALFNSLQSGGATPSTLDFYRTSLGAKAASQSNNFNGPTSQPNDPQISGTMDRSQPPQQDPFGQQHADADAVNGLYMLANPNGIRQNQYSVPSQQMQTSMPSMPPSIQAQSSAPASSKRGAKNSIASNDTADFSDDDSEPAKPTTRSRGKKAASTKAPGTNNRRKAEDTPAKTPANKRAKMTQPPMSPDMEMEMSDDENSPQLDANGKKMTDEEKRKNFLERNRYVYCPL